MAPVPVRRLLDFPRERFSTDINQPMEVLYEDGVVMKLSPNELLFNRYIMDVYVGLPKIPIVSSHNVRNYYTNGYYVSPTLNATFEAILSDFTYKIILPQNDRSFTGDLYRKMFTITNDIANDIVHNNLHYASSIHIYDFLEIQNDPDLLESIDNCRKELTQESIDNTYEVLDSVIRNKPQYKNNYVALNYIAKTFNPNQVKQLLGARGFVTEIDGTIFPVPVATSFVLGLHKLSDLAKESRSAAKAAYLSNKAIKDTEYFAREMQLVTMGVEKLSDTDCGTKKYSKWYVRETCVSDKKGDKSDLPNLRGKYYLNELTGKEEIIMGDEKHLLGKTIKLRQVENCNLSNPRHVCTKCFGALSVNVPKHSNLGHICSTHPTSQISQNILSTKHLTASAIMAALVLSGICAKFFTVKNKNSYAFRTNVLNKSRSKIVLYVPQDQAIGLRDIDSTTNVHNLTPTRVSNISEILLRVEHNDGRAEPYIVPIRSHTRSGSFTYQFLEYIKQEGVILNDNDQYVIDLKNWTTNAPVIELPQVEYSFLALAKAVKNEFKSMPLDKDKKAIETPSSLTQKVFDLLNSKLNINLALIEVIVYAFTAYDQNNHSYNLGRNSENSHPARLKSVLTNRSLSGAYAWEEVHNTILAASSFDGRNGVNHPLDVMLKPDEAINDTERWSK